MKVILLEDVKSLGKKGELVEINEGYARNFILKKKLGLEATAKNMNDLKLKKANEEKVAKEQLEAAKAFAEELKEKVVTVSIKTGEGGRVFGSVSTKEIAAAAKAQLNLDIDKKKLKLKNSGLPSIVLEQTPKYARRAKVPIVKVKAGPRVMNLIADAKIYDQILPKQEIKATVSGIYITSFKRIRGPIYEPPKKKKHFWQKSK